MVSRIQLENLDMGKTDCKNELLRNTSQEKEKFESSFLLPENIKIDNFLQRQNFEYYFITGLKGVGKTCLLRYVGIQIDKKSHLNHIYSSFILFKSDLTDEKSEFARLANNVTKIQENEIKHNKVPDYNLLWDFIIHKHIVSTIEEKNLKVFKKDIYWEKYYACVKATIFEDENRFIPKIKNGNIKIKMGAKISSIFADVNIDYPFSDESKDEQRLIKFEELMKSIDRLYKSLTHDKDYIYILFDELELTSFPRKFYNRDVRLIRDLITTINKFNAVALSKNGSVFLIAAIRSEVLISFGSLGSEINKLFIDFGVEISWANRNRKTIEHPLLKMLEKRIQAAEVNYDRRLPTQDVWGTYFPKTVDGIDTRRYILFQTWYRPRDIIRLLLCAKRICPKEDTFSQKVFHSIKKEYSEQSWVELCEELRTTHNIEELDSIQQILHGYQREFSFDGISKHVDDLRKVNKSVNTLLEKYELIDILNELYRVGVLGNACRSKDGNYYRFVYRGDPKILPYKKIIIHRGLLPYLCIND